MSDYISGFTVTLEKEMHEESAERLANAIRQIRGVVNVTPTIATMEHYNAKMQERIALATKIHDVAIDLLNTKANP